MAYTGGKNGAGVYQTLINHMPPHAVYIAPFLGEDAVMQKKRPAALNIGIDRDAEVIGRWHPAAPIVNGDGVPDPLAVSDGARFHFRAGDGIGFLETYPFNGNDLVYCDPPYLMETRKQKRDLYRYELDEAGHIRLLDVLRSLPCMVMVSGYFSELYQDTLNGWHSTTYQAMTRSGQTATEWLWMNYPAPLALHDYSFLGSDYRERERIKRKKQRWINKLQAMPILERRELLAAMREAWPSSPELTINPPAASPRMTVRGAAGTAEDNEAALEQHHL